MELKSFPFWQESLKTIFLEKNQSPFFGDKFSIVTETVYIENDMNVENALNLSKSELSKKNLNPKKYGC